MAERMIPRKTKIKMELFKGVTIDDAIWVGICMLVFGLFVMTDFEWRYIVGGIVSVAMLSLVLKKNGRRMYTNIGYGFTFLAFKKAFYKGHKTSNMRELIPYVGILDNDTIDFRDYYAKVIEIQPLEFGLLSEFKQDQMITSFSNAFRRLAVEQSGSLVKITKPMLLDGYEKEETRKFEAVMTNYKRGMYSDVEIAGREIVFDNRKEIIRYYNEDEKVYKDHFYFVIFGKERNLLDSTTSGVITALKSANPPIRCKKLDRHGIISFLRANYTKNYDEREIDKLKPEEILDWIMPKAVKFGTSHYEVDGEKFANFVVSDYPMTVGNSWGYRFFSLKDTRVVMNFNLIPRTKAESMIDKSIIEMETQMGYSGKTSVQIEKQTALQSMKDLLTNLKNDNEALFDVKIHLSCELEQKKEVRARLREMGFNYDEMFCRQQDAFISANVSALDRTKTNSRGINTTSLAAVFPFISSALQDPRGFYVGYNQYPVFVDFFRRDDERVNSNMIVIGRSGSGKSYATKTLISNLLADDSKIFICDPENEYERLCHNVGGKIIDVGSGAKERFNPFHVMMELEDDEGQASGDNLATHLQFLEEFFRMILDGISVDALEALNRLVVDLYKSKNITSQTDIAKLKPEDFPIFDDLYKLCLEREKSETDAYSKNNLKIVSNYIAKFAEGGRVANLWNGKTNIEANENFVVFSFRSLLANRNLAVGRAQMLLTFKYLDNEIIKNREYNLKYHANEMTDANKCRKIIIVVDEAHTFINPKFPIALDFMFQMAKRIRKYNGMQIVITQNILDFMGSEEMIRQSSAIIAASQYSLIMSLSPNDVTELVKLYKNAGEINETEQEQIASAGRGDGFFISSAFSRTQIHIFAPQDVVKLFGG